MIRTDRAAAEAAPAADPPAVDDPVVVETIDLYMPITAAELNDYLQDYNVRLHGSGAANGDILAIDTTVTVPERGTNVTELAVDEDVTISVEEGCELRINGT
ncbi:MAG: hypothetical protein IJO55_05110, partial [Lachnospiraceae bacterium]|nr:hypothetical protein [Lachnospiraceae bacterium]